MFGLTTTTPGWGRGFDSAVVLVRPSLARKAESWKPGAEGGRQPQPDACGNGAVCVRIVSYFTKFERSRMLDRRLRNKVTCQGLPMSLSPAPFMTPETIFASVFDIT